MSRLQAWRFRMRTFRAGPLVLADRCVMWLRFRSACHALRERPGDVPLWTAAFDELPRDMVVAASEAFHQVAGDGRYKQGKDKDSKTVIPERVASLKGAKKVLKEGFLAPQTLGSFELHLYLHYAVEALGKDPYDPWFALTWPDLRAAAMLIVRSLEPIDPVNGREEHTRRNAQLRNFLGWCVANQGRPSLRDGILPIPALVKALTPYVATSSDAVLVLRALYEAPSGLRAHSLPPGWIVKRVDGLRPVQESRRCSAKCLPGLRRMLNRNRQYETRQLRETTVDAIHLELLEELLLAFEQYRDSGPDDVIILNDAGGVASLSEARKAGLDNVKYFAEDTGAVTGSEVRRPGSQQLHKMGTAQKDQQTAHGFNRGVSWEGVQEEQIPSKTSQRVSSKTSVEEIARNDAPPRNGTPLRGSPSERSPQPRNGTPLRGSPSERSPQKQGRSTPDKNNEQFHVPKEMIEIPQELVEEFFGAGSADVMRRGSALGGWEGVHSKRSPSPRVLQRGSTPTSQSSNDRSPEKQRGSTPSSQSSNDRLMTHFNDRQPAREMRQGSRGSNQEHPKPSWRGQPPSRESPRLPGQSPERNSGGAKQDNRFPPRLPGQSPERHNDGAGPRSSALPPKLPAERRPSKDRRGEAPEEIRRAAGVQRSASRSSAEYSNTVAMLQQHLVR